MGPQSDAPLATRCGIDTVDLPRIERLLAASSPEALAQIFAPEEIAGSGHGPARVAHLAARVAAKEACLKLFPREAALGTIGLGDFTVTRDGYGAPHVGCSAAARALLGRYRLGGIALSLTHSHTTAAAVAVAEPAQTPVPLAGRLLYHALPIRRRVVLANLRRVFGGGVDASEIRRLAQAHYAHLARLVYEFATFPLRSARRVREMVHVENAEAVVRAHAQGKGVLVLTAHLGNWEVATVAGIAQFPQHRGRFHFVRRPLHPRAFDALVTRRFRRAGFGVLPKTGVLDAVFDRLAAGDLIVFTFDQHAAGRDGIRVDFLGQPAWTFRSLALIALSSGAPVVPAATWRTRGGRHVLRFEEALPVLERSDPGETIRANTQAYNIALERFILQHPEQWFWMHRRWKDNGRARR